MPTRHFTIATLLLAACSGGGDDSGTQLPEEEVVPRDTGEPWEFVDTGGGLDIDDVPADFLTLRQWGAWTLTPAGGPYTSLSGEFRVQEYLNGARPTDTGDTDATAGTDDTDALVLACDLVFSLFGSAATDPCPGCAYTFEVEFALLEGDPSGCSDPNLPRHESQWTLGYHAQDQRVLYDYANADLWLPWYTAQQEGDLLSFDWEVTVGVAVEEEED